MNICKITKIFRIINRNNKRNIEDVREIDYENLKELIKSDEKIKIVDIRSPQEFEEKRIKYAINIPLYDLKKRYKRLLSDKDEIIVLYCGSGIRSKKAYKILKEEGYANIYSLKGGLDEI